MATPYDFDPQPRSSLDRPPPAPPRILKNQIYTDPRFFKDVDDHAVIIAQTDCNNARDLIWNLILKKNLNELQRARVIFRWMTMKDILDFTFKDKLEPGSLGAKLQRFQSGDYEYSSTFECLASHAGLHCVTVQGWAKGVIYEPGMQLTKEQTNHSWNAVHINGNWQLVDCEFATRHISEQSSPDEYDDFYFMPDPSDLIFSHFPEDPAWQLLQSTRTASEFDEYPSIWPSFFSTGMHLLQQNKGIIYTHDGILTLTLGKKKPAAFTSVLSFSDTSLGVPLHRYIIQETTDTRVTYYLRAPKEGTYYLTTYAQQVPENLMLQKTYNQACSFKVICNKAMPRVKPFPACAHSNYGPGVYVKRYGLTSSEQRAILLNTNGHIEVIFSKSSPVYMLARLRNDEVPDTVLKNAVSVIEQSTQVRIKCKVPAPGEYRLDIYAKKPSETGNDFPHICQYLVAYTDQDLQTLYGKVFDQEDSSEVVLDNHAQELGEHTSSCKQVQSLVHFDEDPAFSENMVPQVNLGSVTEALFSLSTPSSSSNHPDESAKVQPISPANPPAGRLVCRICLEDDMQMQQDGKRVMSTTCGHIFCETCMTGVLNNQQTCPTCRKPLSSKNIHPIYL